jgi:hypothetical protein
VRSFRNASALDLRGPRARASSWAGLPIVPELETAIREALRQPGRTEGIRKIAERFGVNPGTVQRISRPFEGAGVAV